MKYQSFDSGALFIPACERWKIESANNREQEYLGDMLRIRTITTMGRSPTAIIHYFGLKTNNRSQDLLLDLVGDIQMQVYEEMLALTGEEYRLDWSRRDGAFCLWYRDRDHRRDATRDLLFVRTNTKALFDDSEIRNSPVHGFGLFALRKWFAGEVPCDRLDGQVLSHDEYEQLQARMAPALGRMRHFFFMEWNALRDIQPDEEFTLDYRLEPLPRGYFETPYSGYLTPVDWRSADLQPVGNTI